MNASSYLDDNWKVSALNFWTFMLWTSWWICKSVKLDGAITNSILSEYCTVDCIYSYYWNPHSISACAEASWSFCPKHTRRKCFWTRLACCVRCFTLSLCSHKTPLTWEKTNYSFTHRCPGAFSSLRRPPGYITCVPQGWLWHGSCHSQGPLGGPLAVTLNRVACSLW